jgi:aquaporin Z
LIRSGSRADARFGKIANMTAPTTANRLAAELIGTFWLVLAGCGAAVFAADPAGDFSAGIGSGGVAFAFGLAVMAGTYAFGGVSGGHFNPAVTLGVAIAGRVEWPVVLKYWLAQVTGAVLAAVLIVVIGHGRPNWTPTGNMAANGYGANSPFYYSLIAVLVAEVVLTLIFILVFLRVTDHQRLTGFAALAIGLTYTVCYLVATPISNASINPARSTGVAFFNGAGAPGQLWAFWAAPLVGAALAGLVYRPLFERRETAAEITGG